MKTNFQDVDTNSDGVIDLNEAQVMADYVNEGSKGVGGKAVASGADEFAAGLKGWISITLILSELWLKRLVIR